MEDFGGDGGLMPAPGGYRKTMMCETNRHQECQVLFGGYSRTCQCMCHIDPEQETVIENYNTVMDDEVAIDYLVARGEKKP